MSFSEMSSKEKTIVVVLGVVILVALIGIGILVARLVTGNQAAGDAPQITVVATPAAGAGAPEGTITPVATPFLEELAETTPQPVAASPVVVVRTESPGSPLPALLTSYPLHAGRVYRLEITAVDGSGVPVQGSWSQAAMGAGGEVDATLPDFFEANTPFGIDVVSPVPNPSSWSVSASAAPANLLGQTANLVITVYDVTGTE